MGDGGSVFVSLRRHDKSLPVGWTEIINWFCSPGAQRSKIKVLAALVPYRGSRVSPLGALLPSFCWSPAVLGVPLRIHTPPPISDSVPSRGLFPCVSLSSGFPLLIKDTSHWI